MSVAWLIIWVFLAVMLFVLYDNYKMNGFNLKKSRLTRGGIYLTRFDLVAIFFCFSFAFFCATRSINSYDTFVYEDYYETITSMDFFTDEVIYNYKPGFELLTKFLCNILRLDFRTFLFAIALLNNVVVYLVVRNSKFGGVYSYILYVFLLGFFYNFCVLRQALAITMVIISFISLDKSKIRALIYCYLATFFHETAWVILAILFLFCIKRKLLKKWALYSILGASVINYIFNISANILDYVFRVMHKYVPAPLLGKYEYYFIDVKSERNFSLFYMLYFVIAFFIVRNVYMGQKQENSRINVSYVLTEMSVLGTVILSFFSTFSIVSRVTDYLILIPYILLLPDVIYKYKKNRKCIYMFGCILALLLYLKIFISNATLRLF